jgi:hypothetical protein
MAVSRRLGPSVWQSVGTVCPRRRHELRSGHVDPPARATAFVHRTPACRVQTPSLAEWELLVLGEASADENAALIGEHLEAAGDLTAAYDWHMRAAEWAINRDVAAARLSWERARQVADALPADEPDRTVKRIAPRTMLCGTPGVACRNPSPLVSRSYASCAPRQATRPRWLSV